MNTSEIKEYKERLEHEIKEYMEKPVSERSLSALSGMVECWKHLDEFSSLACHSKEDFDAEKAENWNKHMVNTDGTIGGRWAVDQTSPAASSHGVVFGEEISPYCWNVVMNMMYSDYGQVATKYGVASVDFFADMSRAFLMDADGGSPKEKVGAYYENIFLRR